MKFIRKFLKGTLHSGAYFVPGAFGLSPRLTPVAAGEGFAVSQSLRARSESHTIRSLNKRTRPLCIPLSLDNAMGSGAAPSVQNPSVSIETGNFSYKRPSSKYFRCMVSDTGA